METLAFERKGPVAWVWLNRPAHLNAMNPSMFDELRQVFRRLKEDATVKTIVLAGRGETFSAGFDVSWMVGLTPETVAAGIGDLDILYDDVETCPQPLIVAVHGPAVGGGLLLALVADLVLASGEAGFGVPEVKLGFFPPLSLVPRLERRVGLGAARYIVLTGELIDASEAHRIGLVERVLPADALYEEVQELAERLAALPSAGVRLAKEAFAAARSPDYRAWETAQFVTCWASPDRQAAVEAFLAAT